MGDVWGRRTNPRRNAQINDTLADWANYREEQVLRVGQNKEADYDWKQIRTRSAQWLSGHRQKGLFKDEELRPIPLLQTEVKQRLVKKQDSDAAEVIKHLSDTDGIQSVAGRVYTDWRLDRRQIKDCHIAMKDDRRLQVTLNNIVAAIRFKTFGGQRLVRARCQKK